MNMKQLKYVIVLAQVCSFSRAADMLNISQSSLSQYVKKIEKQVGMELFDRANGDVRLTDAGRVYIDIGRKILDLEHQMEVKFSDISAYKTGSLIIGAAPYRTAVMLPEVAKKFQQLYPGMYLEIQEGTTAELAGEMEKGKFDLCLTLLPLDERLFVYEKVVEEELVLVAPSDMKIDAGERQFDRKYPVIDTKQLDGMSFVKLTDLQYMQHHLDNIIADCGISVRTAAVAMSLSAQIALVKAGVGAALMPTGIERVCEPGEVNFYSFRQQFPKRQVVVMWRKDRPLSKAAEDLKNIIVGMDW